MLSTGKNLIPVRGELRATVFLNWRLILNALLLLTLMEPTSYSTITPVSREKATAIIRFVAVFIDSIIAYVPMIILGMISSNLSTLGYLLAIGYMLTRDSLPFLNGQSVGKKLMSIKVIREDTGAGIMGDYGTGVVRAIPQMIPILNLVDALVIFRDSTKRFGDEWAKTIVVKA